MDVRQNSTCRVQCARGRGRRFPSWTTRVRAGRLSAIWIGLGLLAACLACHQPSPYATQEAKLKQFYRSTLGTDMAGAIEVPYEINDEIKRYTDKLVSYARGDSEKVSIILDAILSRIGGGVEYDGIQTRNAVETFRTGRGNCMSFTNLFVGMARHAGVPVVYVMVDEIDDFEWFDDILVHQKHMCSGVFEQGKLTVIDFVRANTHYWRVRHITDGEAVAYYYNNLGYSKFREGKIDEAVANYRVSVALSPTTVPGLNNLGVALVRKGETEEAIRVLKEALQVDGSDLSVLSNLASALSKNGKHTDAMKLIARMNEVQSHSSYGLFVKARLLRQKGNHSAALTLLRRASQKEPRNLALRIEMARTFMDSGEKQKALQQYKKVLQIDPNNQEALSMIQSSDGPR